MASNLHSAARFSFSWMEVFPRASFYDLPHVSQSSVRHPEEISATGIRTAAFQITRNVLIKIEFKTFVSQAENVSNLDFKIHEKNFYFFLLHRRHGQSFLLVDVILSGILLA